MMIKKVLKYLSVIFIFTMTLIILINYFRINSDNELSDAENYLRHVIVDHKINESSFGFTKINFSYKAYLVSKSSIEINVAVTISLFLIPATIIFYNVSGKNPNALGFLFTLDFNNSLFRPPRFHS